MSENSQRKNLVLGRGLIGSHLADFLKEKGEEVKVLSRDDGKDLREAEKYIDEFKWADRVWFIAWDVGVWKRPTTPEYEIEILDSNLRLCQSVFGVLEKTGTPFLFVTSQLASRMITLGVTKRVAELWSQFLDGHIARFWNVYGWEPIGEKSHLIPDLIWEAMEEGEIKLMSDGKETRQFLYVRDCVEAIFHQFNAGQKYADVTSGEWVEVRKVAELIGEKLDAKVIFGEKKGKPSLDSPENSLESWSPRFSLSEGLDEVIKEAKKWKEESR